MTRLQKGSRFFYSDETFRDFNCLQNKSVSHLPHLHFYVCSIKTHVLLAILLLLLASQVTVAEGHAAPEIISSAQKNNHSANEEIPSSNENAETENAEAGQDISLKGKTNLINESLKINITVPEFKENSYQQTTEQEEFSAWFKEQQEQALKAADESQVEVSERLYKFSTFVDNFFSNSEFEQESEDSRLRVSIDSEFQEHADPSVQPRLNLSLPLSNTKKKLRLLLESNDDENQLQENPNVNSNLAGNTTEESFSSALGLQILADAKFDIRGDVGIKFYTPIDPFTKIRVRRTFKMDTVEMRLTETLQWRDSEGNSSDLKMEMEYPFRSSYFFRSYSNLTYWDVDSYWAASQSFTLYDQLNEKTVIAYSIGIQGQNENETHDKKIDIVNYYWIETRYRKNFYKDWLFYEVTPGFIYPREYDFDALAKLELKLEAVFGNITGH